MKVFDKEGPIGHFVNYRKVKPRMVSAFKLRDPMGIFLGIRGGLIGSVLQPFYQTLDRTHNRPVYALSLNIGKITSNPIILDFL